MRLHLAFCLAVTLGALGCKPRNVNDAGLFSAGTGAASPAVSGDGDWRVTCQPRAGGEFSYVLDVRGATSATDEEQELVVSVTRASKGQSATLASAESGHGALSAAGPIFIGFLSGVLTAAPVTGQMTATHAGVLTLAKDPDLAGVPVLCSVAPTDAPG